MPSLLGAEFVRQKRPVPSLYGADILNAEWVPSLQGAEFARCRVCGCRVCEVPKCPVFV